LVNINLLICFNFLQTFTDLYCYFTDKIYLKMKIKLKLLLFTLVIATGSAKFLNGQEARINTASDTLVVLWSSGDPDVAEKACLMYAGAAKKYGWFKEVIIVVWGPSEKLLAENAGLKEKVATLKKDGVVVEACVACSNMYGVTNDLKVCQVDVKGMGVPLTKYLKRGYKLVSY
jgi:hypothetical protein